MGFYINLPLGILAAAGLAAFLPNAKGQRLRFDWLGFTVFAMGIGALQLMLDRGNIQDWFSSREIIVEAVLAALGIYVRPPQQYTHALKRQQIREFGYADGKLGDYEEDHLVPLGLGGAPYDPRNLWPEPRARQRTAGMLISKTS
jgi:hypothetical protein